MPFRIAAADAAVTTAWAETARLGLAARVRQLGPPDLPTTRVGLHRLRATGRGEIAAGCGKGGGAQGASSAHFEALERYLMSSVGNRRRDAAASVPRRAADVAAQPALEPDRVVQRWAAEFPDAVAACAEYHGPGGAVRYPTFLVDPRYHRWPVPGDDVAPYRALLRYSSSLGTAAGLNFAEAVYHGLCELVEQDGLGLALLRWFVSGPAGPDRTVAEVAAADLPTTLATRHGDATRAAGAPVRLLDVTTDLGVPVYLAISTAPGTGRTRLGCGASIWATDAADRALSELIQVCALTPWGVAEPVLRRLEPWPVLQRCVRMPVDDLPTVQVPLRPDPAGDGSPAWGLEHLARTLAAHGIDQHAAEIAPIGSLISVASVIAPGLERFSLVRHGVPVVPTGRGQHLWPSLTRATA
jgi:ribosomal protein S12 methylthiotransferase accessory factor